MDYPAHLVDAGHPLSTRLSSALEALRSSRTSDSLDWTAVAGPAQELADSLRTEELRTTLGKTELVRCCAAILDTSVHLSLPWQAVLGTMQLLRIIGNLCFDNNVNRQQCLDTGIPATVVSLIEIMACQPRPLPISTLQTLRASIGALMNCSLDHDPTQESLRNAGTIAALVSLLDQSVPAAIYSALHWTNPAGRDEEESKERIRLGSTIAGWTMDILVPLLKEDKTFFPPASVGPLVGLVLSLSVASSAEILSRVQWTEDETADLIDADVEIVTAAATLLEGLALKLDTVKESLAAQCLVPPLLDFVEFATPPPHWSEADDIKAFSAIKASVVRALVEVPNSEVVMAELFSASKEDSIVPRLVSWLEAPATRQDLIICATHMLAALGRTDAHCLALVNDYSIAPRIAKLLHDKALPQSSATSTRPGEDTQLIFGLVSLLRHLAIPLPNRRTLGAAGVIVPVSSLLRDSFDVVAPLQATAVTVLKHLVYPDLPNALEFLGCPTTLATSASNPSRSPLDSVLALLSRTDDVRLRSESTRTIMNATRAVFSASPTASLSSLMDSERAEGRNLLVCHDVVAAMSDLARLAGNYPMLVNEAVVGMTLLAGSGEKGATLVNAALLECFPAPPTAAGSVAQITQVDAEGAEEESSPPPTSSHAVLVGWIELAVAGSLSEESTLNAVRPGMVANVCVLLATVAGRGGTGLAEHVAGPLRALVQRETKDELTTHAQRALDAAGLR